ncbi:MAG: endo alpha-1,4 polygalactosaminidase [Acidimicrobiia bacterium]
MNKYASKNVMKTRLIIALVAMSLLALLIPANALVSTNNIFAIISPTNNSTVSTSINFSWTAYSGATNYKLLLTSTDDPYFEGPDYIIRTSATSISKTVYPMTYLARVVARDASGARLARTSTITFTASSSVLTTSTSSTLVTTAPTTTTTKPTATTTVPVTTTLPNNTGGVWTPKPLTTWYWQINGRVNENISATMYDIDLFDAVDTARTYNVAGFGNVSVPVGQNAGVISRLKAKGKVVICYVDTGAAEYNRPDYSLIPTSVQGTVAEASDGTQWSEKWLDTRSTSWSKFAPIMWARFDLAKQIGCDGVEPDQNNHVGNNTGFPESVANDQAWYLEVARQAHARGLSVGMKNGVESINATLVSAFDWHLNEECNQYSECDTLAPFIKAGKAVFNAEYPKVSGGASQTTTCSNAAKYSLSSMGYPLELGGGYFFDCITGTSVPTGTTK